MKSLAYHCSLRHQFDHGIDLWQKRDILNYLIKRIPFKWRIPDNSFTRENISEVLEDLDWNASPGYPYVLNSSTNRSFFRVTREGKTCAYSHNLAWQLVEERLKTRGVDPIRLFIKPEPHKMEKIQTGRFRLISSISVVDQIIDHMLFDNFNAMLIKNYNHTPIKVGWAPVIGGWRTVQKCLWSTDKSSWDWTVTPWLLDILLDFIKESCENMTGEFSDLIDYRFKHLFVNPIYTTSNGLHLQQLYPGVVKSGSVLTITGNSVMQLALHYRAASEEKLELRDIMIMGDDVCESPQPDNYYERLSKYCKLKDISYEVEFAGFRYEENFVSPCYIGKHAWNLLHMKESLVNEVSEGYALLYHRSRDRDWMRNILSQVALKLPTLTDLDEIWDGE